LISEPYFIHEEEVPRAGTQLRQAVQPQCVRRGVRFGVPDVNATVVTRYFTINLIQLAVTWAAFVLFLMALTSL
jgi:hypothetical protein